jgi:hypothetical protein
MNVNSNWLAGEPHKVLKHKENSSFRKVTMKKKQMMVRHENSNSKSQKCLNGRNRKMPAL